MTQEQTDRIRSLNDQLRCQHIGGRILATQGIKSLGTCALMEIIDQVKSFNDFTPDNDPYNEHDFGSLIHAGHKIFWKIDYYDQTLTKGSEDASDPDKTCRVLTIMLAEEY